MNKRLILLMAFFIVFYVAWQQLGIYLGYIEPPSVEQTVDETDPGALDQVDPNNPQSISDASDAVTEPAEETTEPAEPAIEQELVILENEELLIELDNRGGVIKRAMLKNFYESTKKERQIELISSEKYFPGEIILSDSSSTIDRMHRVEKPDERSIVFINPESGLTKTFKLEDGFKLSYKVESAPDTFYAVAAEGLQPIYPGDKLVPSIWDFGAISPKILHMAWSQDGDHEHETPDSDFSETTFEPYLKKDKIVQWAGVKDTYFANVLVPDKPASNLYVKREFRSYSLKEKPAIVPVVALEGSGTMQSFFYLGPIYDEELAQASPLLENLLSYGWAGALSKWLFYGLDFFHDITGNWGWAIIILTLLIRAILIPLTIPSVKSGYKMRQLQPKIEKIKKKYSGDDLETKQKLSQETFALYKKEGVNPFSSCFTMLAQMPVFFAYFSLLRSSIYLRQADWMFWVSDLSIKDGTYILPIIMGATMFFSTMAMPMPSADPMQAKMMKFMPVLFSLMFLGMPAGLILYMITSNVFTMGQTYFFKWRYHNE